MSENNSAPQPQLSVDSQNQAPLSESASPAANEEIKKSEPEIDFSSRFAALSRKEKQLLEKERKLKELEKQSHEATSKYQSYEEKLKQFKANPDLLLQEVGISFEDLVNLKLGINQPEEKQVDPNELYKQLKQEMQEELEKIKKEKEEEKQQESAQIIENFQNDIRNFAKKNADKYELINYQGDYDLVFEVVDEYYAQNGELLSIEQACDHVESYLESLVDGAVKLKKFESKFAPKKEAVAEAKEQSVAEAIVNKPSEPVRQRSVEEKRPTTLSNSLNSGNSSTRSAALDLEESKRRAAQLLRWS
jgi:sRNA-binding carbon storage regulator CsrA